MDRSNASRGSAAGIRTRAELAQALTTLRSRSGLTVRELARRLNMPTATVGDYFSGRHLPGPAQLPLFCELLRACGVTDDELTPWLEVLAELRRSSDGRVGRAPCPYRGMQAFDVEDADLFFGREKVTEQIIESLRGLTDAGARSTRTPLLIVLGPSGSGKSSLLRAGLAARLGARDPARWSVSLITPAAAPANTPLAAANGVSGADRLLIVDQLEEIFAMTEQQRADFLGQLGDLLASGTIVLAGLRADFYEAASREPVLLPALREGQILLGPLAEDELRSAITEPARQVGVPVEDALVEVLLADLAPGRADGFVHETGVLPLLSHALLETWERSHNRLTVAAYRDAGGLRGAVSQRAEELYRDLTPRQQELARRLFCRLVRVQEGPPYTRRTVTRRELERPQSPAERSGEDDPAGVLDRFIAARLVTADAGTIAISHEALLNAWPRLSKWIEQDRAGLSLHQQITDGANAWIAADRDPSMLLRGARLQLAEEWAQQPDHRDALNQTEQAFLDAALSHACAELQSARRRTRRTQQLLGALVVLALTAIILAVLAFRARSAAEEARDQALSRQVAIEAQTLERTDPALGMQLALAAYRISHTPQAASTLLDSSAQEMPTRRLGAIGPTSLALGGAAEMAIGHSATDTVALYRLSGGVPEPLTTIRAGPSSTPIYTVALSPDGRLLAAAGAGRDLVLWSLQTPQKPTKLATLGGFQSTVYALAFSPSGQTLAAADGDGTVAQWSLTPASDPVKRRVLIAPGHVGLQSVAYSPNGEALASAGAEGKLIVWRAQGSDRPIATETAPGTTLTSLAYSPDGRTLAAGGQDALVHLWATATNGAPTRTLAPLKGFTNWVDSVAFSHSGRYLAAGDSDNSLKIWSTAGWDQLASQLHPAPVTGIAFASTDEQLVTVDEDGTARSWPFPLTSMIRTSGGVFSVDYTASGDELAAVSGGPAGDVALWDVADPWRPREISAVRIPGSFGPAAGVEALSPNGRLLAVGDGAGDVRLLELTPRGNSRLTGPLLRGASPAIDQLAFSPDMRTLLIGDEAGHIHRWDISNPQRPIALSTLDSQDKLGSVLGIAYSPDGKLLAAAGGSGKVWLWKLGAGGEPELAAELGGFATSVFTVGFTPTSSTLIAGSGDDTIRLWDVSRPSHPRLLHVLRGPTSTIYDVSVSPNGNTLAAATTDQDVWLWNIRHPSQPREIADLTAASGIVYDVTFSPNGSTLAAAGADETLHFWDYHIAEVTRRICALAGDPITPSEWKQYIQGVAYDPPCRQAPGS